MRLTIKILLVLENISKYLLVVLGLKFGSFRYHFGNLPLTILPTFHPYFNKNFYFFTFSNPACAKCWSKVKSWNIWMAHGN
jgi:hypothetical protein